MDKKTATEKLANFLKMQLNESDVHCVKHLEGYSKEFKVYGTVRICMGAYIFTFYSDGFGYDRFKSIAIRIPSTKKVIKVRQKGYTTQVGSKVINW